MGLIVRIGDVTFHDPVRPGEHVTMEVTVRSWHDDGVLFDGEASMDGRRIAEGRGCLAVPTPLEGYCSAEDLRVLFSEIHRPLGG
jgi:3-hydroxymyristoyl/3-hydroxydecanoyl-(acyl carrier protein) dehydratase